MLHNLKRKDWHPPSTFGTMQGPSAMEMVLASFCVDSERVASNESWVTASPLPRPGKSYPLSREFVKDETRRRSPRHASQWNRMMRCDLWGCWQRPVQILSSAHALQRSILLRSKKYKQCQKLNSPSPAMLLQFESIHRWRYHKHEPGTRARLMPASDYSGCRARSTCGLW